MNKILQGDCLKTLKTLPDNSIDAIVTDPPYGLSFMGKKWDYDVPKVDIWKEAFRVLKPGGYLLSFAGTRTQHRMAVNIEDAGFEIRDMIAWVYGSGFPKSFNIAKALEARELTGSQNKTAFKNLDGEKSTTKIGTWDKRNAQEGFRPNDYTGRETTINHKIHSEVAKQWEGWGTALKPALEPITVARKPIEGTVAENCLKWGVGGINIDGCRVGTEEIHLTGGGGGEGTGWGKKEAINEERKGRFPANLIHDGSDEVVELFPNDSQRFFYCAKASKSERNMGCDELPERKSELNSGGIGREVSVDKRTEDGSENAPSMRNFHPTVKPIALMEYLIKLVSKEGHTILDPFAGSGSTLIAAKKLKRNYIGCELDPEYIKIAEARLSAVKTDNKLF